MDRLVCGGPVIVFRSYYKMDNDLEPNWTAGQLKYSLVIAADPALSDSFSPTQQHPDGDQGYTGGGCRRR
ncbi:hypothetical protein [Mycolicibacterium pyrenivorans]|uniref:hypothetical protein n=1 Tax=Mycolicibacterium pyrenivorans TaxID=187102 RepID=UPI0021F35B56|nr:hypothetical protein [Mycolicibacterium pyrenivorans]MCV7154653.1 hypothetical protein [Mycolicibacterium pyrenivorans]